MLLSDSSKDNGRDVLVVEPDWDTVEAFGDLSSSRGMVRSLHWAGTLNEALSVVSSGCVDTVVIDLRPPVGEFERLDIQEGLQFIRYLNRRRHRRVRTIVLAGKRDSGYQVACFGAGASEFVVRDQDPKQLAHRLCTALEHLAA